MNDLHRSPLGLVIEQQSNASAGHVPEGVGQEQV